EGHLVGCGGEVVEGGLDVDRRDVVRQQQDLVGVQLARVLAGQVLGLDQPGLQQADDEGAGPGEGVQHVHALVTDGPAELVVEDVIDAAEDEVDDLYRGIDHAHRVGRGGERVLEEG